MHNVKEFGDLWDKWVGYELTRDIGTSGKSQKDIAEALGTTDRTIRRWMRGQGINSRDLQLVCREIGVPLLEFLQRVQSHIPE